MSIASSNTLKNINTLLNGVMFVVKGDFSLRLSLLLSLFLVAVTILLNVIIPFLFRDLIHHLRIEQLSNIYTSLFLVCLYAGCWSLRQVTVQLREIFCFPIIEKLLNTMIFNLFKRFLSNQMDIYPNVRMEKVIDNIIRTQESFSDLFAGLFLYAIPTVLEILIILVVIGVHFPYLFCCVFGFFIFFHIAFSIWGLRKTSFLQKRYIKARNIFQSFLMDKLINFETIKIFSKEYKEEVICRKYLERYGKFKIKADVVTESIRLGQGLILGFLVICSTIVGMIYVKSHSLSVENLILLNFYFIQLVAPLGLLGMALKDIKKGLINLEAMIGFMKDIPSINSIDIEGFPLILKKETCLKFDNVFYNVENKKILEGISFEISQNKILGIIGKTGSGKSTIAKLILRLLSPSSGQIFLNNKRIEDFALRDLRKVIGYVPQYPTFFNDSIYNNLRYANQAVSMREIEDIIEKVHLTEVIQSFPEGYNTSIGKNGVALSGGQIQLLALARVLLMKPKIYVFDEITSALDPKTQEDIVKVLKDLSKHSSIIIISHRMSLIHEAHEILVLSKGKCVKRGNPQILKKEKGLYANLLKDDEED